MTYRNDPKFSDRQVLVNSADPDQTAPKDYSRGAVFTVCISVRIIWTHDCVVKRKLKLFQFKDNYSKFCGCPNFRCFKVLLVTP